MSNGPHRQSTYKLRKLPTCSRCNTQFMLILAQYENLKDLQWEWECPKCHKIVPKDLLREDKLTDGEQFIKDRIQKIESIPVKLKYKQSYHG